MLLPRPSAYTLLVWNIRKRNLLIKTCSVLPFAITTCQFSLLLCLFFAWSNIFFSYSVKKFLTSSRKIKRLNNNKVHVCMSMWRFLGSFCAYCFTSDHVNIIFPSSKQSALKWCLPWQGEPLTSCQEQTIEKKGCMSCVRELCHSFGYQLKLTGTITCVWRTWWQYQWETLNCHLLYKKYSVYTWKKWMGIN